MVKKTLRKIKSDTNLKELVSGSVITFILKSGGLFLSYILVFFISEKFGEAGVGYYSLTNQLLIMISTLAAFGTTTSVLRYVGQFNNKESRSYIKILYGLIWKIIFPIAVVISIIVYFSADFLAIEVFKNEDYSIAIQLLSLVLPIFVMDRIAIEFLRGFKLLKISEFVRTVSRPLLMLIALFVLWEEELKIIHIVYFIAGAIILNFLISNLSVISKVSKYERNQNSDLNGKELLRVSSPMMISAVTGLLITTAPLFILESYVNTSDVGVYSLAFKLAQGLTLALVVVNTIAAPKFSELYWANKHDELQKVILQSTKMMFWSATAIAAVLILGGKSILGIFKGDFSDAYLPMLILVIGQMVNAATGSVGLFLNMSGNQKILRNTAFISFVVMLILSFILIPQYAILGAAIAASVGIMFWNILCILLVKKKLGLRTYYVPFMK